MAQLPVKPTIQQISFQRPVFVDLELGEGRLALPTKRKAISVATDWIAATEQEAQVRCGTPTSLFA